MKKQQYTSPEMEIIKFESQDPITASCGYECGGGGCSVETTEMGIGS